ncbi:MAG TPA: lysylphosphatidylglycerol synthase domain-containing protein [Candidatus Microsaccharimonas sp.]|nr:lysylphosphatidylglycerol synthase domain-containing protein [Candidatus Microsaccharimonas sp.]
MLTAFVFIGFFHSHPQYWHQLQHVPLSTLVLVFGLNVILLSILAGIYRTCIHLCAKQIGGQENFLLTAYSSIINFFGPLQSGPGVRAAYLKTKLHIRLRDYTFVTLLYYALFAIMNILFLCIGSRPWWQTLLAILLTSGACLWVLRRFTGGNTQALQALNLKPRLLIVLATLTFLQIAVQCLSFYVELHTINAGISLRQAITYTGAADLALFVSLTPGAIGFRESFLVFSHSLHHISTANILSANLIDRAVYVVFLVAVFVVAASTHASTLLRLKKLRQQAE